MFTVTVTLLKISWAAGLLAGLAFYPFLFVVLRVSRSLSGPNLRWSEPVDLVAGALCMASMPIVLVGAMFLMARHSWSTLPGQVQPSYGHAVETFFVFALIGWAIAIFEARPLIRRRW